MGTEGERKKHHPNNYLIQFNENFIRNNTKQQKQGMGVLMPLKKGFICAGGGGGGETILRKDLAS